MSVHSKLEYGLRIWRGTYATTFKPLLVLQTSLVRHVSNSHKLEPTDELYLSNMKYFLCIQVDGYLNNPLFVGTGTNFLTTFVLKKQ